MTRWWKVVAALCVAILSVSPARAADKILVFAAASLKEALDDADAAYTRKTGVEVAASYAASGPLARQIESGAPADIFISADLDWMDELAAKQKIRPDTRTNLLGNGLVLIAPAGSKAEAHLAPGVHLLPLLGDGRLAIGDPQSVPAGKYAQQALTALGDWAALEPHLARAESVRAALALVSRGEAPLGIVYRTDAAADKGVRIVAEFPEESHPPIVYPAALVAGTTGPAAASYFAWLASPEAAPFFTRWGFAMLAEAGGIEIAGDVQHPMSLSRDDLAKLAQVAVDVTFGTGHGPESGHFSGPLLWDVIGKAGLGESGGRHNLRQSVLVTGRDGYTVALAIGEISPDFEGKQVILATGGKDVRLIVPGDRKGGRDVRDVVKIEVR